MLDGECGVGETEREGPEGEGRVLEVLVGAPRSTRVGRHVHIGEVRLPKWRRRGRGREEGEDERRVGRVVNLVTPIKHTVVLN